MEIEENVSGQLIKVHACSESCPTSNSDNLTWCVGSLWCATRWTGIRRQDCFCLTCLAQGCLQVGAQQKLPVLASRDVVVISHHIIKLFISY